MNHGMLWLIGVAGMYLASNVIGTLPAIALFIAWLLVGTAWFGRSKEVVDGE